MKIKIILDNPKRCDGCPLLVDEFHNCLCRYFRGFLESMNEQKSYEYHPKFIERKNKSGYGGMLGYYKRPKDCIEDNGA